MIGSGSLTAEQVKAVYTNSVMQDIIHAIPGGVAVYRVGAAFEPVYVSDGVLEMSGYSAEEGRNMAMLDDVGLTHLEDAEMVTDRLRLAAQAQDTVEFEFRKQHRNGRAIWVRVQAKTVGEEGGRPLLQCVFHDISALKEARTELSNLVNSVPGGIASYRVEGDQFIPLFYSDGVPALTGHTREEYDAIVHADAIASVYEPDRERVLLAARSSLSRRTVLDVSYRMRHRNGELIWLHLNGRRIENTGDSLCFYAVFTGMSMQTRLFQDIANETADGIYVIDRQTHELLYTNDANALFSEAKPCVGQKCFEALHGNPAPCASCVLQTYGADGKEHEIKLESMPGRFFTVRFRETDWNGIPAYVQYIRDVTEEVRTRQEKERLEMYFQTVVGNLPGGISVIRCDPDGGMTPEFISDGFAAMTHMTVAQAGELYQKDIFAGVHPDDVEENQKKLRSFIEKGDGHCTLTARMACGDGGYVWVKDSLSVQQHADGVRRIYSIYTDITKMVEEQEQIRCRYEDIILQHYRKPGADELVLGHCNVTTNRILDIVDHTNSDLLETFGDVREAFFTGVAGLIVDPSERQAFLDMYLNEPALAAFHRHETECVLPCFIKLPKEKRGRYVQFKVNLIETPVTGDITGVLTVTDITEQTISDRILHQLSVTSYDYVIDVDLEHDRHTVVTCSQDVKFPPPPTGRFSERVADMVAHLLVPKDRSRFACATDPTEMRRRLKAGGSYTISYGLLGEKGEVCTKNMTISAVDLRLDRFCLVCSDITESVREEQSLLNMMAYTFDLMGILHLASGRFTLYTRQTVLENLAPRIVDRFEEELAKFVDDHGLEEDKQQAHERFSLANMLVRLAEQPSGYDFVVPFRSENGLRYKQINVLWGDENHSTICLVRADVTDILAAERKAKQDLERALDIAEEANRAKSDFLSTMSHDIRTPMNAIMGMTTLAVAHMDDRARVADCLQKIKVSSKHLLSLINDILDMSKIEQSQISLNRVNVSMPELLEQLSDIMVPQARLAGLQFSIRQERIEHQDFLGDSLRISQILINLTGNAIKFTQKGGAVGVCVEEIAPQKDPQRIRYRFTVSDTGIGMTQEFLANIFAPFARSRAVSRVEGTGLGLSITKGLIDLMGGEITVESKLGEGSVFRVELEYEAAECRSGASQAKAAHQTQAVDLNGRTFLIAEDNEINAEILQELLSMEGARSVVKTDGRQALRAFESAAPDTYDAVLMDVQMPEMDGYQATRAIRSLQRRDAGAIPIVAMTANAFSEDIAACLESGMNAHVAKPVDMDTLRFVLSGVLDSARPMI
ncbi:PAS domain-containing protein [Butyricicoccus faecihominis]|uniref:PAS domain-containing hybrid sensor histidine kinase/response regulator n=1 Tax=Butyricicoccus faecihominis TaxID=1712515 RepID=UPI002478F521|nr:PAS domain-containing protein [Butyricicoccus faecihominis]MCQ5130211.1 PAS domain-containing protein [Butyricicoccus faecihominis]